MTKKLTFLFFLWAISLSAQKSVSKDWAHLQWSNETEVIRCSEFHITRPLRELAKEEALSNQNIKIREEKREEEHKISQTFRTEVRLNDPRYDSDQSIVQRKMGRKANRAPIKNWEGQSATGFRPFDPSGAAGKNYYIQMINATTYKIWKKNGDFVLKGTFGKLWSPATANEGDPIVLYDKEADRWFMSQFGDESNKHIYIAVSKTGDPTGQWYTYTFTSPEFPDYLKFSVWQDGYYMTANYTQRIFAFNRAKMLAGNATAEAVSKKFNPPHNEGFFVPLPADASDGTLPGAGTPCPIISYQDDGWNGVTSDAINIYEAKVNWSTLKMQVSNAASLPTRAFNASYSSSWKDIPQPGTNRKLDGIGGAMMFRAQWKHWQNYNSVVVSWAVKVSNSQRGIFWAELRKDTQGWKIHQQGIYAPGNAYYWMSSIAMNDNGDIALCYAKGGKNTYMSLGYAGRHANDPLGTMPIAEVIAQAGKSAQRDDNRDGDYAQTTLDPDGLTFWHTGEYMSDNGKAKTRVYSFRLPASCSSPNTQASNFNVANIGDNQMDISWTRGSGDRVLVVAHKATAVDQDPSSGTSYTANANFGAGDEIGSGNFVVYDGTGTNVTVTGLDLGTSYHFAVYEYATADHCYNLAKLTGNARTTGTVACNMCYSYGKMTYNTSITSVKFNTINKTSAKPQDANGNAYSDYTDLSTDLVIGSSYNLTIKINTDGPKKLKTKVWIDWNQDCDFDDSGEAYVLGKVEDVTNGVTSNSPKTITVPSNAILGKTLMRVSTKFKKYPTSCETNFDGEVEDYTINVIESLSIENNKLSGIHIYPNPTYGKINVVFDELNDEAVISIFDLTGQLIWKQTSTKRINHFVLPSIAKGVYEMQIQMKDKKVNTEIIVK